MGKKKCFKCGKGVRKGHYCQKCEKRNKTDKRIAQKLENDKEAQGQKTIHKNPFFAIYKDKE